MPVNQSSIIFIVSLMLCASSFSGSRTGIASAVLFENISRARFTFCLVIMYALKSIFFKKITIHSENKIKIRGKFVLKRSAVMKYKT